MGSDGRRPGVVGRLGFLVVVGITIAGCASADSEPRSRAISVDSTAGSDSTYARVPEVSPTTLGDTSPASSTTVEPAQVNRHAVDELPRSVSAVLAVAGDTWYRLDYQDRTVDPPTGADFAEFGISDDEAVAVVVADLADGHVTVVDGGVDAATLRSALVATGVTPRLVDGVEVFPVPRAGAGLAQIWFDFDSVAFVDDFLALMTVGDTSPPEAGDLVATLVAARDTEPVGVDAIVTVLEQVVGAEHAWVFTGGGDAAQDLWRMNQRDSQASLDAMFDASRAELAPAGRMRGAVGLDPNSATTIVAEFATAEDAVLAAEAYRAIWETGTYDGITWRDFLGPISISPVGNLVIGTSEGRLDLSFIPMVWTTAS